MAEDLEKMFRRAKEAADRGNYDYAIALFQEIIQQDPSHTNAWIALKGCQLKRFQEKGNQTVAKILAAITGIGDRIAIMLAKSPEKKIAACERYLQKDPTSLGVLTTLGQTLQKAGHLESAVIIYEFMRQIKPDHVPTLKALGDLYEAKGDFKKAQLCYQEVTRIRPGDQEAQKRVRDLAASEQLHGSWRDAEDFRDKIRDTEKAAELEKEQKLVASEDEIENKIAQLQAKLKQNPEDVRTLMQLGDTYRRADKLELAIKAYKQAYKINKEFAIREIIGDLQVRLLQNRWKKAQEYADQHPNDAEARKKAEEARQKYLDFGVKELEFRLRHHPTDTGLRYRLGEFYLDRNDYDSAIAQFQKAVDDPRRRTRARVRLGRAFRGKGLNDLAIKQYEQALKDEGLSDEARKEILYEIGNAYEEMGQPDKALDSYKKVYEEDIEYRDVGAKIEELTKTV